MSTDRDLTTLVRSWLQTDEHESADRVVGAVFDRLDTTPQRRPLWRAWRNNLMNGTFKLVAAGTAAVLVGLKPGPDEVRQVAIGAHCAASRAAVRASASNAARRPFIA